MKVGTALALAVVLMATSSPPARAQEAPSLTKDRLSADQLAALVAAPLARVESAGLVSGQAEFEHRIAQITAQAGPTSPDAVDALAAFGIGLHALGDPDLKRASLPYLRRAADLAGRVYGEGHPEYALALNDYALVAQEVGASKDYRDGLAAIRKAHAIRVAALGPAHLETLSAQGVLAAMLSEPTFATTNREACREAIAVADDLVAALDRATAPPGDGDVLTYADAVTAYAHCGEVGRVFTTTGRIAERTSPNSPGLHILASKAAAAFQAAGYPEQAASIEKLHPGIAALLGPDAR